ncbi:MAG: calcium-translocating P-type ATPase, PMCA-type [Clostridia bacterium]|nr:calcium-translocating P-type ATPase, PMCA-type [Clostridia bacterium]
MSEIKMKLGLSEDQVKESRKKYGSNTLTRKKRKSFIRQFIGSFGDPIIKILMAALAINVLFLFRNADWFEAVGIAAAIFLATFISTLSEFGSESAFLELQRSAQNITCRVMRKKGITEIPVGEIVVGDIVLLQAGERIPADGILINGRLRVDQSSLNGESKEAEKFPKADSGKWDLNCNNQLFQSSVVTEGDGMMEVRRIGDHTFLGNMAGDLQDETPESPLKERLNSLASSISKLGYIAAGLIAFADLFNSFFMDNGMNMAAILSDFSHLNIWLPRVLHALTLATAVIVMAVPEGLPMMITVVLSSNMLRMLKDQVMVRKLVGIETSGSLNILFTDKTGTLTKGRLQVVTIVDGQGKNYAKVQKTPPDVRRILELNGLYNTACDIGDGKVLGGNATDRALMESILPVRRSSKCSSCQTIPFDSRHKFSVAHIKEKQDFYIIKGAPEKIIGACKYFINEKGEKKPFQSRSAEEQRRVLSAKAIRMIAVAIAEHKVTSEQDLKDLTFVSLLGLRDEIRREVPAAIREAESAGIQVVMMTGDSKDTAIAIGRDAGLLKGNKNEVVLTSEELAKLSDQKLTELLPNLKIIARALPTDKSRLVRLAQSRGLVTGMTGDGINDAPALKRADVGFAMGSGTEVAKEAGDIIILDNNFASISKAIRYGRTIFKSIRKFIVYQFTMNLCAVGVSLIGPFIGIDTPVTVIQMLWINIIMDTLAGLAFAGEPALSRYMKERPKSRKETIISKKMTLQIIWMGGYTMALCTLFLALPFFRNHFEFDQNPIPFLTAFYALFIYSGVFNSFNARTESVNPLANLPKNPIFIIIMLIVAMVQLIMIYFGGKVFRTSGLSFEDLRMILLLAFTVIPAEMIRKIIMKGSRKS